jgi:cytochrome c-type biogenesis protein CcmF
LAVCFSLYARHAHRLLAERVGQGSAWCSRDLALQLNNLGLAVACASVLLGTVYPLAMDALGWGKLSVGAPYFDTVMAPLLLWLAALAVPAIWLGWGREPVARLRRRLRPTVWVTGLAAPALAWGLTGYDGPWPAATWLALCVATAVATSTLDWARQRGARPVPAHTTRVGHFGAGPAGMVLAHLGVAVFMVGVAMVNGLGQERDVRLAPGDQVALGGCQLQLTRLAAQPGPNWQAVQGQFLLRCPDEAPRALTSEKRVYVGAGMPLSESAIDVGWSRDLYVALGEPLTSAQTPGQPAPSFDPQAAWSVRVQVKPFIRWVWAGVLLMAVGCALAALQRWRPARVPAHDPAPGLPPPVTPDPHAALN